MSITDAFKAVIDENVDKYPYFDQVQTYPEKTGNKYMFLLDPEEETFIDTGSNLRTAIKQRMNVMVIGKANNAEREEVDERLRNTANELIMVLKNNRRLVSNIFPEGFLQANVLSKNEKGGNVYFGNAVRLRMLVFDCKYFVPTVLV